MLAENRWAGYDSKSNINWSNPAPWRSSFFISGYVCLNNKCSSGNVDWHRANDHSNATYSQEAINGRTSASEGSSPWPSSGHPGGVNVVYCDGHLKFLSDRVDGAVYASLVTPQGHTIHGPLAQPPMPDE